MGFVWKIVRQATVRALIFPRSYVSHATQNAKLAPGWVNSIAPAAFPLPHTSICRRALISQMSGNARLTAIRQGISSTKLAQITPAEGVTTPVCGACSGFSEVACPVTPPHPPTSIFKKIPWPPAWAIALINATQPGTTTAALPANHAMQAATPAPDQTKKTARPATKIARTINTSMNYQLGRGFV